MKVLIVISLFLLSSRVSAAENIVVYFGGGGEAANKDTTIFDQSIAEVAAFAGTNGYRGNYFFTNQHKTSAEIAKKAIGSPANEFTSENWNRKIDQLVKDIDSGAIGKGSKLLVAIDTHGSVSGGAYTISTVEGQVIPEDKLRSLIQKAEDKGVQIAVIARSCGSGNLLSLASPKTCIITGALAEQYAYAADDFFKYLSISKNLEDAFLRTRRENTESGLPSQPAISSPAGLETQRGLNIVYPYLSAKEQSQEVSTKECNFALNSIESLRKTMSLVAYRGFLKNDDFSALAASVSKYDKSTQALHIALSEINSDQLRCFKTPIPFIRNMGMGMGLPTITMGMMGPGLNPKENYEKFTKAKWPDQSCVSTTAQVRLQIQYHNERLQETHTVDLQDQLKATIQQLNKLLADPVLQAAERKMSEGSRKALEATKDMIDARKEIAQSERRVYAQLYDEYSHKMKNQPNACHDFSLLK